MRQRPGLRALLHPLLFAASLALLGGDCGSGAGPVQVAVFGDSHSDPDRRPAFDWLGEAFVGIAAWDHAVAGDTCDEVVSRVATDIGTVRADVVVLFCGTNDATVGWNYWRPDQVIARVEAGLDAIQGAGKTPVLVAPPPVMRRTGVNTEEANVRLKELHDALQQIAQERGIAFVDVWAEVWATLPQLPFVYADGLHLEEAGQEVVGAAISRAVLEVGG